MISEEHLESTLLAIRAAPLLQAREILRGFAVGCRHDGMLDFATSLKVKTVPDPKITINDANLAKMLAKELLAKT